MLRFWKFNDENDLLFHSLARLNDKAKVDLDHVPSTTESNNAKKLSNKQNAEILFKENIQKSFAEFSRDVIMSTCADNKTNIYTLKHELRASEIDNKKMN